MITQLGCRQDPPGILQLAPLRYDFSVGGFTPELAAVAADPAARLPLAGPEDLLPDYGQ
jgi:hypothetical protein